MEEGKYSQLSCGGCGDSLALDSRKTKFCSRRCSLRVWKLSNPERVAENRAREDTKAPDRSAYYTGYCRACSAPFGARSRSAFCSGACANAYPPAFALVKAIRLHKQDAKVVNCAECNAQFCPLYGASHALLCDPCKVVRHRASKAMHRVLKRAATVEMVDPFRVFDRDAWRCQLCDIKTPKSKRGTYADNAPELDHIMPLSKGGAHSYINTQCACRKCNGLKSDKPMGQMLLVG